MASTITQSFTLASYLPAVHEPQHDHAHDLDNVQGYLVVRTDWSGEQTTREPIAFFVIEPSFRSGESPAFTHAYGEAVERVRAERLAAGKQQYAVIDSVYDCGCRFIG